MALLSCPAVPEQPRPWLTQSSHRPALPPAQCALLAQAKDLALSVLPALHVTVYRINGKLLASRLLERDLAAALDTCLELCSFLAVALQHVPAHPLLGLQWFTAGDLALVLSRRAQAKECFTKAHGIICITHGEHSSLAKSAGERLVQCH